MYAQSFIFNRTLSMLLVLLLLTVVVLCATTKLYGAEDNSPVKDTEKENTITVEYGWCNVTFPKSVKIGVEFDIVFDMIDLKDITRNWEANKLAVHLFWDSAEKWGGYLSPFSSVGIAKDGIIKITGKFTLTEAQKQQVEFIRVSAVLCSEWENQGETKVANFMGPRIAVSK